MEIVHLIRHFVVAHMLILILILAGVLRTVDLAHTPNGFHADEASYLINTISMLETGRDEDNRFLPVSLHSLTDPKPALYSYVQLPFIAALGATTAASRLPAALLGVLSLFIIYTIFVELKERQLGLITIFVLAISPWHIVISRGTQEVITSFVFLSFALLFLLLYVRKQSWFYFLFYLLGSLGSMYLYHSAKIIWPLFVSSYLCILYFKKQVTRKVTILLVAATVLSLGFALLFQNSSIRLQSVNILSSPEPKAYVTQQIYGATKLAPKHVLRFFYNKPHYYGREILRQYVTYFSPSYLFFDWSEPKRYVVPFHGLLYILELPLLILGLVAAIRQKKNITIIMLVLLVIAPLPAVATAQEIPSTIRPFPAVIPISYFIALGINEIILLKYRTLQRILLICVSIAYVLSLAYFLMQYFIQQKVYRPWSRNSPYEDIAMELGSYASQYNQIVITSDLRPLYAYFSLAGAFPIESLRLRPLARMGDEYSIGKYVFSRSHCRTAREWDSRTLYIMETGCLKELENVKLSVQKLITYRDGEPVYAFVTYSE